MHSIELIIRIFERRISTDFTHPKLIIFLASLECAVLQSLNLFKEDTHINGHHQGLSPELQDAEDDITKA